MRNRDGLRDASVVSVLEDSYELVDRDETAIPHHTMVHVFIVHRSMLLLEGLTALFARERDIRVVGLTDAWAKRRFAPTE